MAFTASIATLADDAVIRDGLMTVVNAGISLLARPLFPASMEAVCAVQLSLTGDEAEPGTHHDVIVQVRRSDDSEAGVTDASFEFVVPEPDFVGIPLIVPLVANFKSVVIAEPGDYKILILSETALLAEVPFKALDNFDQFA